MVKKWKVTLPEHDDRSVDELEKPEELDGQLGSQNEQKLAKTLIEDDKEDIDKGNLLSEAMSNNMSSFIPDLMMQNMVNNFKNAERMYGPRVLKLLTGFEPDYIERNIKIPEFERELQGRVNKNVESLKDKGLIDEKGAIQAEGKRFASLVLMMQELDHLIPKGLLGEYDHKKQSVDGISDEIKPYKNNDRFRDLAVRKTLRVAIRRGHDQIQKEDLRVFERESKGKISIIYAVDASGSMKGEKLTMAKKAGIALAYKATEDNNDAGLLAFSNQVELQVEPTKDFWNILQTLMNLHASNETNIRQSIEHATTMFKNDDETKHLILLTDGAVTTGKEPQKEALAAAAEAVAKDITISVVGIQVDEESQTFCQELASVGKGNCYLINDLESLDSTVLQDYNMLK